MKKNLLLLALLMAANTMVHALVPITITNNSQYQDSELYIAVIGKTMATPAVDMYIDLTNNNASTFSTPVLNGNVLNTLHRTAGDWGYANIFVPLSEIPGHIIYVDRCQACRLFVGFKSPMYLHAFDQDTIKGYAGADLNNPNDPNADLRWEVIEFTYDNNDVFFVNTTRVDAFQYPMGIDLYGNTAAGANNAHMRRGDLKNYAATLADWNTTYAGTIYTQCLISRITRDALGPIIMQPSKVAAVKNANVFDSYIAQIWSAFTGKRLHASMGERGVWSGQIENGQFVMRNDADASQVAYIGRPSTTDVIEGAGTFATGSEIDKAVQAQFCGAINRGMINCSLGDNVLQDWGNTSLFFTQNTYNEYVRFFHRSDLSYDGYTYAFAYDDTFDQSSTCATSHPASLTVSIGGFTSDPGAADETPVVTPGTDPGTTPATNSVAFRDMPSSVASASSYTVSVDYTAAQTCEVMVCLFKGEWNVVESVEEVRAVDAGSGTLNIALNYSSALTPGDDYIWKCEIRPTGGSWANHYMEQLVRDCPIVASSSTDPVNPSEPTEPTEGTSGTGTTAEGLQYSYSFSQSGTELTVTFTALNASDFTGLVPFLWDATDGFREILNTSTTTVTYSIGTTVKMACKWAYAGGMTVTPYVEYLMVNQTTTDVANIAAPKALKVIRDGRLLILRDGAVYDALGRRVE